jgi:hypothetical protein
MGHTRLCAFGQPPHPTSDNVTNAITLRDGVLETFVSVNLTFHDQKTPKAKRPEPTYSDQVSSPSHARTTPEALLNRMLVEVGATQWRPGADCTNESVFGRVRELGARSFLNYKPMLDSLYVAVERDSTERWETKLSGLVGSRPDVRMGTILVGEVQFFRRSQGVVKFKVNGIDEDFKLSNDQVESMRRGFPRVWSQFRSLRMFHNRCRVVFFGVISVNFQREVKVESICFRLMSKQYIPCDSFCEVKVAHKLVLERRTFERVIFARDNGTKFRADFELLDLPSRCVMEIFGFNSQEYLLEMESKIKFWRNKVKCRLWYWKAYKNSTIIPRFPRCRWSE